MNIVVLVRVFGSDTSYRAASTLRSPLAFFLYKTATQSYGPSHNLTTAKLVKVALYRQTSCARRGKQINIPILKPHSLAPRESA